jgi:NADPH-dependent F420 reductase
LIGIVGGSGDFGQGLAGRLRRRGYEVVIGSRTPRDEFVANPECCERSDVVFLSIPPAGVAEMTRELAPHLAGRIAVSVAAPVVFRDGRPGAEPGEVSLAEIVAREAPAARVVAGFQSVSAKLLADLDHELDEDVLLCGDDDEAKAVVSELAEVVVAGRAVDCGPLVVSRWIEPITAVLLNVNRRYKANAGLRITGLP